MDELVDLRRRGSMLLIRLVLKGLDRLPTEKNKLAATARREWEEYNCFGEEDTVDEDI